MLIAMSLMFTADNNEQDVNKETSSNMRVSFNNNKSVVVPTCYCNNFEELLSCVEKIKENFYTQIF